MRTPSVRLTALAAATAIAAALLAVAAPPKASAAPADVVIDEMTSATPPTAIGPC